MTYTTYHEFAGFGGDTTGVLAVPGTRGVLGANHNPDAIATHALNFPGMDHYEGDIAKADIGTFPRVDFFWASPSCPPWTDARGVKRDFDQSTQGVLFDPATGPRATDPSVARARALMEEVPRYLQAMNRRGRPVLGGVTENVVQVVKWDQFKRWRREIEEEGYRTRLIALNAMHVTGPTLGKVAQSRNRFFLAYWLEALGRDPDWDKWLRPRAYCPDCDVMVSAVQAFKKPAAVPGTEMGVYGIRHGQYVYRCPHRSCRRRIIEPGVLPASEIIDWSLDPGQRIGERVDKKGRPDPLEESTIDRIEAGLARHVGALLAPAGGTWREHATSLAVPLPTRTTRETDGLVCPPLLVSCAARAGVDTATTVEMPLRTQTCRRETAVVVPPFVSLQRGGGSATAAYPIAGPIPTVSAQGNHHGLVGPPAGDELALLVAYYGNGGTQTTDRPVGTLTTRDRYGLLGSTGTHHAAPPPVEACTFRMLEPHEIAAGMGFPSGYKVPPKVAKSKRKQVRGWGNAVPPAMAEVLASALIETFSGEPLEPAA
ncbi:DNA cytosine methyltransferase [Amycolatopsis mediterranei]|uniref:DNA (cytosine-5-)-methyltransferase n=2 Tax=Amycolatopsis mediterranei TaxID=33910 RepID=A0A0H3DCW0_AMYMU|nr:DNA cytosine methyltransferase [Amycolatopsis mediterranei]ADJ47888.1 DNA (cytosine-5-)-methyltransferase [Amycolatopsis mediterranei U32]UZF72895.1 DNA cytosine methyltransferase [Amycolatopsis mediterranei]